jgi:hypothetical protein
VVGSSDSSSRMTTLSPWSRQPPRAKRATESEAGHRGRLEPRPAQLGYGLVGRRQGHHRQARRPGRLRSSHHGGALPVPGGGDEGPQRRPQSGQHPHRLCPIGAQTIPGGEDRLDDCRENGNNAPLLEDVQVREHPVLDPAVGGRRPPRRGAPGGITVHQAHYPIGAEERAGEALDLLGGADDPAFGWDRGVGELGGS